MSWFVFEGAPEVLPEQPERAGTWGHFIGGTDSSWGMWISLEKIEFSVPAPEHPEESQLPQRCLLGVGLL